MTGNTNKYEEETQVVLPLHAEEVTVAKQQVVTGRTRVHIATRHHERRIEELLTRERVEIERRPIGRPVARAPEVREEGDMIIIPVVEEEVVVERRLILKEEICIRRIRETLRHEESVDLRDQDAVITRDSAPARPEAKQTLERG